MKQQQQLWSMKVKDKRRTNVALDSAYATSLDTFTTLRHATLSHIKDNYVRILNR